MSDRRRVVRKMVGGVFFWLLFCCVAVGMRGVRWDETFEHAQAVTGQVHYPAGHPFFRYVRNAFSLQTYASAGVLAATDSAAFVCAYRNVFFLAGTVIPVYLLTALLLRNKSPDGHDGALSAFWLPHAAAILTLQGVLLEFDGSYPMAVWPSLYSNGHIGMGYAIITLVVVAGGFPLAGGLLLGFMPCVHIGQMPVLAVLAAWMLTAAFCKGVRCKAARFLAGCAAGLALCGVFWLVQRALIVPAPVEGPYAVAGDAHAIWAGYTAYYDSHRALPPGNGHITLVAALLLGAGVLSGRFASVFPVERWRWVYGYCAATAAVVWVIALIQTRFGTETPFWLIAWMPYRLINHIAPILLGMLVCVLGVGGPADRAMGRVLVLAAVACGFLKALVAPSAGADLYGRYIAAGDAVVFVLVGAAVAMIFWGNSNSRRFVLVWGMACLVAFVFLVSYHQFGAACFALGFLLLAATHALECRARVERTLSFLSCGTVASAVCLVALFSLLVEQGRHYAWLPRTAFDHQVVDYLDETNNDAMLAGQPDEFLLQARTGHAVIAEAAMPSLMSYMPSLAPAIQRIYMDLYGIDFTTPVEASSLWRERWAGRSPEQWQRLAERYGFQHVVAPADVSVELPTVLGSAHSVLYRVP